MSARDIMTAQYATASDPSSGGRQMPGHYGYARAPPGLGLVAGRDPDPARGRDRAGGQDPPDRPGRDRDHGRGQLEPGRRPRGAQLRRDPQAAVRVRRREQRLRDQRPGREGAARQGRGGPGVRATAIPGVVVDGTDVLACYAAAREAVDLARAGGGPDAHRGEGDAADRALVGRPADEVPLGRRPRGRQGHDPLPIFRDAAARRRRADGRDRGGADRRDQRASSTTRPTTPRAQPDPDPATALDWVYAEHWPGETPPPWHRRARRRDGARH